MIMRIVMVVLFLVFIVLMYMRWRTYQKMVQSALIDREEDAIKHNFAGVDFDQNELQPQVTKMKKDR